MRPRSGSRPLSGDKDLVALEKVRAAAQNGPLSDKLLATVPARYADDPGIRFAKIQIARRANKSTMRRR